MNLHSPVFNKAFLDTMMNYLPMGSEALLETLLRDYPLHVRITRSRKTKLGDFRPPHQGSPSQISVNGDLEREAFLITFLHEIAHMHIHARFGGKCKPHGKEWKNHFISLIEQAMSMHLLSEAVEDLLKKLISNPSAASLSNSSLCIALGIWQKDSHNLAHIEAGSKFKLEDGRTFVKGELRRTRYACRCLDNGKMYLIGKHVPIEPVHD